MGEQTQTSEKQKIDEAKKLQVGIEHEKARILHLQEELSQVQDESDRLKASYSEATNSHAKFVTLLEGIKEKKAVSESELKKTIDSKRDLEKQYIQSVGKLEEEKRVNTVLEAQISDGKQENGRLQQQWSSLNAENHNLDKEVVKLSTSLTILRKDREEKRKEVKSLRKRIMHQITVASGLREGFAWDVNRLNVFWFSTVLVMLACSRCPVWYRQFAVADAHGNKRKRLERPQPALHPRWTYCSSQEDTIYTNLLIDLFKSESRLPLMPSLDKVPKHDFPEDLDLPDFAQSICGNDFIRCYTAEEPPVYSAVSKVFHDTTTRVQKGKLSAQVRNCAYFYLGLHHEMRTLKRVDWGVRAWRGVAHTFEKLETEFQVGNLKCWYEPKSASLEEEKAKGFAKSGGFFGTLFTLVLVDAFEIPDDRSFFEEREVLVPILSTFRILAVSRGRRCPQGQQKLDFDHVVMLQMPPRPDFAATLAHSELPILDVPLVDGQPAEQS